MVLASVMFVLLLGVALKFPTEQARSPFNHCPLSLSIG